MSSTAKTETLPLLLLEGDELVQWWLGQTTLYNNVIVTANVTSVPESLKGRQHFEKLEKVYAGDALHVRKPFRQWKRQLFKLIPEHYSDTCRTMSNRQLLDYLVELLPSSSSPVAPALPALSPVYENSAQTSLSPDDGVHPALRVLATEEPTREALQYFSAKLRGENPDGPSYSVAALLALEAKARHPRNEHLQPLEPADLQDRIQAKRVRRLGNKVQPEDIFGRETWELLFTYKGGILGGGQRQLWVALYEACFPEHPVGEFDVGAVARSETHVRLQYIAKTAARLLLEGRTEQIEQYANYDDPLNLLGRYFNTSEELVDACEFNISYPVPERVRSFQKWGRWISSKWHSDKYAKAGKGGKLTDEQQRIFDELKYDKIASLSVEFARYRTDEENELDKLTRLLSIYSSTGWLLYPNTPVLEPSKQPVSVQLSLRF